jgi:hypothetical protein
MLFLITVLLLKVIAGRSPGALMPSDRYPPEMSGLNRRAAKKPVPQAGGFVENFPRSSPT